ncbi:TerC family protein [Rhodovarius crocodyli]|uniref:TerC family protein n=1 Tax=Rhodovarius crocodyli TaxID=1979269 RepID=A0A437LX34_9PROT|nr:YjbE family putative metal transport protein [Rhodovarius crocodyli]RVT89968.1 TerC family protein [Rhodovarius crocodyli]
MDLAHFAANWDWGVLGKILGANIILSGDNAVLIALAAAGLPAAQRGRAIMIGMVLAVFLRIVLSLVAAYLLEIPGIMLVGGLVLLWIAYGFYKETRNKAGEEEGGHEAEAETKTMAVALRQIVIADVSMSLDNVLAVAGAAGNNMPMLIVGLVISILLMGVAASLIAKLLERFSWIAYVGVALIIWIGVEMVWHDLHHFINFGGTASTMIQTGTRIG